jgi:hypothetical protein
MAPVRAVLVRLDAPPSSIPPRNGAIEVSVAVRSVPTGVCRYASIKVALQRRQRAVPRMPLALPGPGAGR